MDSIFKTFLQLTVEQLSLVWVLWLVVSFFLCVVFTSRFEGGRVVVLGLGFVFHLVRFWVVFFEGCTFAFGLLVLVLRFFWGDGYYIPCHVWYFRYGTEPAASYKFKSSTIGP